MNTSTVRFAEARAAQISFDENTMHVELIDGRVISVPLEWFPRLRDASPKQLQNWRLIGEGIGIHWEDLDEDLSVAGLMRV